MRSRDGQAGADYAAVLLVVVAVLAVAVPFAVPGVGERVVGAVRTGICIVGGDVCRDADARAAGLEPCVTSGQEKGSQTAVSLAVLRVGEDGGWSVALQSDGSAVVTQTEGRSVGAGVGVGFEASPIRLELGVDGHVDAVRESGRSWHFATVGAAGRFLEQALGADPSAADRIPPDERWEAAGAGSGWAIGAKVPVVGSTGARAGAERVLGRRTGGGRTTWFFRSTFDDPQLYATLPTWSSKGPSREALVELTEDGGGPRELVIRAARAGDDRVEEVTARLDLRDPEIRARAAGGPPWSSEALSGLARLAMTRGIVERQVHAIDDRSQDFNLAAKLGVALGVEHKRVDVRSRLADATVWIAGSGPRRREDCLGP